MTVLVAHKKPLPFRLTRLGCCSSVAAILISLGCQSLQNATAEGETRTISFHHTHTNEDLTVTYKVNGRYDDGALAKIDNVLRDWREDKTVRMDPHVIDLLWEVHREVGAKEPIWVVCGYRSPSTNSMLRRHSSGVAKASQHMNGKAVDFYIPGVPLDQLRAAGLRAQRGGVGFYPTSGSPFVHLDTGNVRHWPRMPEAQLASVLSKGPLTSQFASDRRGTAFAQGDIQRPAKTPGLLARLFGGGNDADEEADAAKAAPASPAAKPQMAAEKPAAVARANTVPLPRTKPEKPTGYAMASAISIPVPKSEIRSETSAAIAASDDEAPASLGHELSSATFQPPVRLAQATNVAEPASATTTDVGLPSSDAQISPQRSAQGAPQVTRKSTDRIAPSRATSATVTRRAPAPGSESAATANGTPWPLPGQPQGEPMPNALFYAAQPTPVARAVPTTGSLPRPAAPTAARGDTTVVAKHSDDRVPSGAAPDSDAQSAAMSGRKIGGEVRVGDRFNDPWMRAMILSPSAQSFMKTTLFGKPDFRDLGSYLQKPATVLANAFKDDPHPGMTSEKFVGSAVTFVSANTFGSPQTKR